MNHMPLMIDLSQKSIVIVAEKLQPKELQL